MTTPVNRLADTFAVLTPALEVKPALVTPTLYQGLEEDYAGFAGHVLVSSHEFSEDWPTWEVHPAGDEIVMLLSGRATLVLRNPSGDETVTLTESGSWVVVPRGIWHTARVGEPTRMLFITPGEGTQNSESPDA